MNVPSGYTALDMVGFTDKGPYNSATAYVKNDIAHYGGNLWRCLVDDTTNVTPTEGANWTVFLAEPTSAAEDIIAPVEVSAVSTHQYAVGKQLILNDTLYRVTAAVNIGDTLAVGTNITASGTVVDQLANKANTSSLATVATSGSYADLSNKPTLGTAAAKDVPASGNASTTEVVMGDDTRLTDARNAADVYSWAKASTKPTYNGSEINTAAAQSGTAQLAISTSIAAGTSMDGAIGDLLDNDATLASDIQTLSNYTEDIDTVISANGAKNLLINTATTTSHYGVIFTVNPNGTVTPTNAASGGNAQLNYYPNLVIKAGTYKLSGCPAGGSGSKYYLQIFWDNSVGSALDIGEGVEFTLESDKIINRVCMSVMNGYSAPSDFKPMITFADQPNSDYAHYVPYAKSNRELTEDLSGTNLLAEIKQLTVTFEASDTIGTQLGRLYTAFTNYCATLDDDDFVIPWALTIAGYEPLIYQGSGMYTKASSAINALFLSFALGASNMNIYRACVRSASPYLQNFTQSGSTSTLTALTDDARTSGQNMSLLVYRYKKA